MFEYGRLGGFERVLGLHGLGGWMLGWLVGWLIWVGNSDCGEGGAVGGQRGVGSPSSRFSMDGWLVGWVGCEVFIIRE